MKAIMFVLLIITSLNLYATDLKITDAKIRLVPPTSSVSALFMKIKNNTKKDLKITSIESNISKIVELHNMIMDNGGMQMRPVENIELKANSITELKRGGLHVMFIELKKPLKDGDIHKIKINLDDKTSVTINAKVQVID